MLFFLFPTFFFAQELEFNLSKAASLCWQGNVYCYGFSEKSEFKIYKLNAQLKITDSLTAELGKINPENYLNTSADTLHNFLNIYVQEKETQKVSILRLSKNFELLATIKNVDVARLNNTALFGDETLYYKNLVYSIKTENDTSGKQFYLNKYELKSEKENFDYQFKWQFPFEKKNIRSAHVFYANKNHVFVFVNVVGEEKAGQWILKINASDGMILKGSKLNSKLEKSVHVFGNFMADSVKKSLCIMGQKFTETQFNQKDNKLNFANAPAASVYLADLDSAGQFTLKQEFKIPIVGATPAQKPSGSYVLRIERVEKNSDGKIWFETDIYNSSTSPLTWTYENTTLYKLNPTEENYVLEKNTVSSNPMIKSFYFSNDKQDINGKLMIDTVNKFEKLFYKRITLPVKQQFKTDSTNNAAWILTKHNLKKNSISYSFLKPEKKIYKLSVISEIQKSNTPVFISVSNSAFIVAQQTEEKKYKLKLYKW
ncbi:MAG: hypothetical protein KF900_04425 [Bacteroidetes bacterium]|nr:hypothetical protein [Bacteroidota bacterium]